MRVQAIRAENWMAYETLDLDLVDISVAVVVGRNNHGKSAILDALTWCLFGKVGRDVDQRVSDQYVRRGTDVMYVEVVFATSDGHTVAVRRERQLGKSTGLALFVDGDDKGAGHTIDQTERMIEEWVGLNYAALMAGPFMVQAGPGQPNYALMSLNPGERKDLLIAVLDLRKYEALHKKAKAKHEDLERTVAGLAARVTEAHARLADRDAATTARDTATAALAAAMEAQALASERVQAASIALAHAGAKAEGYEDIVNRLARLEPTRTSLPDRIAATRASIDRGETFLATEPSFETPPAPEADVLDQAALDALYAEAETSRAAELHQRELAGKISKAKGVVAEAERKREILPTVPCGGVGEFATCRFLTEVPSEATVTHYHERIEVAEATLAETAAVAADGLALRTRWQQADVDARAHREALAEWRTKVAEIERTKAAHVARREQAEEQLANLRTKLDEDEHRLAEVNAEWADLQAKVGPLRETRDRLDALQADVSEAQNAYTAARERVTEAEPDVRAAEARLAVIAAAEVELADVEKRWRTAQDDAADWALIASTWSRDGVPTAIIERTTPLIEERANATLAELPDDLRVALRTQRPTKGGMAEKLDIVITTNGWESAQGLISVGARFRVDIALRLALQQVLAHRSGRSIQTLVLDEPLAALDREVREAVVETINALASEFGLVLVISHDQEFNDRIPSRIDVDQESGISTAKAA